MPILPNSEENFIKGLSDFWERFFIDSTQIEAFFEAAQIELGQVYLELMQNVLGTSLQHVPLFSKKYYQLLLVREDQVVFKEGASINLDRYNVNTPEVYVDTAHLMNRIISPTNVLDRQIDFDIINGTFSFVKDPFNYTGDSQTITGFPVRYIPVTTPADLRETHGLNWKDVGVKTGDLLQVRYHNSLSVNTTIRAIQGQYLILSDNKPEFLTETDRWEYKIFRTPYDTKKDHLLLPIQPVNVMTVIVPRILNSTQLWALKNAVIANNPVITSGNTLTVSNALTTWVGQRIAIIDSGQPGNTGLYTITSVVGTLVTIAGSLVVTGSANVQSVIGATPENWIGSLILLNDETNATNNGYFTIVAQSSELLTVDGTLTTTNNFFTAYRVQFSENTNRTIVLDHQYLIDGTVTVHANRLVNRIVDGVVHLAGQNVQEGIDYTINYEAGTLTYIWVWDPALEARISYQWRLLIDWQPFVRKGEWSNVVSYGKNDIVVRNNRKWISVVTTNTLGTFIDTEWREYTTPFRLNTQFSLKEIALWAPDTLLDEERLYTNFGYLLSNKKPSSEQYRTFLRGISQLFLLGPSLERFESALNVVAQLPVIRTEGETLKRYTSAFLELGAGGLDPDRTLGIRGELIDSRYGNNGVLSTSGSTFTVNDSRFLGSWSNVIVYQVGDVVLHLNKRWTARGVPSVGVFLPTEWIENIPYFFQSDIGSIIQTKTQTGTFEVYTITSVDTTGSVAVVTPAPVQNETQVNYTYKHNIINKRFTVKTNAVEYAFSQRDVGATINITTAKESRNIGAFKIVSVEGPKTLYLEDKGYTFIDENELTFRLTHTSIHTIETNRDVYEVPFDIVIREDLKNPTNRGYVFRAFEPITEVIRVVDYISDPTWWHNISIPEAVLKLETENAARRQVSPLLVEHLFGCLDGAVWGDFGIYCGTDDEQQPGIVRDGLVTWLGNNWLKISLPTNTPKLTPSDIGRYLHVEHPNFGGDFQIQEILDDGITFKVDRFPPPEARSLVAPWVFPGKLPPLIYRRTVAFILMDRFLKYHAMKVEINTSSVLTSTFFTEAAELISQVKPAHTWVYFEPITRFKDIVSLRETFEVTFGPYITDYFKLMDNTLRFGTEILLGEYFYYLNEHQTIVWGGGNPGTVNVATTFPTAIDRQRLVFLRLSATTSGKPLQEGVDYTVDYVGNQVTFLISVDAGNIEIDKISCGLTVKNPTPSPWYTGQYASGYSAETPVIIGGLDPLIRTDSSMVVTETGLIDRPLQVEVS